MATYFICRRINIIYIVKRIMPDFFNRHVVSSVIPFILHCDETTLVMGTGFIGGGRNFKYIRRGEGSARIKVADGIKPDMIIIQFCFGVVPQFRYKIGKVLAAPVDGPAGKSVAVAGPADWCAGPAAGPVGRQDAAAVGPTGR